MLDVISLCLNKLKQILLIRFSHILPHNVWHFELATDRMIAQNINPLTMHIVAIFEALCLMCGHSSFSTFALDFVRHSGKPFQDTRKNLLWWMVLWSLFWIIGRCRQLHSHCSRLMSIDGLLGAGPEEAHVLEQMLEEHLGYPWISSEHWSIGQCWGQYSSSTISKCCEIFWCSMVCSRTALKLSVARS